jgi:hypothetical protein
LRQIKAARAASGELATAMKFALLTLAGIVFATVAVTLWNGWRFDSVIGNEVRRLGAAAKATPGIITEAMLAPLPEPAQRYFHYTGVVGTQIPAIVTLRQTGRIRGTPDARWMTLEAIETYSTTPPAFVWRAWFPRRLLPMVFGRDKYLDGEGAIAMKVLGTFTVADERGPELKSAGLMRYLNEMMWFPAAFLGSTVRIAASDSPDAFNVSISDRGEEATATIFVGRDGSIQNFRAVRYDTSTRAMQTWETPITGQGKRAGLNLPVAGAAVWKRPSGDFTYIELEIGDVTYD